MGIEMLVKPSSIILDPDQPLEEALETMINEDVNFAPVTRNNKLVGILSLTAGLRWSRSNAHHEQESKVKDVMESEVAAYIETDDPENTRFNYDSWVPVEASDGKFKGVIYQKDLTAYLQQSLDDKRERNQSILESVHNGIIAINLSGHVVLLNREACRLLGVDRDIIGKHIQELFPQSPLPEISETGDIQYGQKMVINGRILVSNRSPIVCNNKIMGALAVFQDITELEKVSSELATVQRLNRELDAIIESSFDGVMITDDKGVGIRINQSLARLTGLDASHFEGKLIYGLFDSGIFLNEPITVTALREGRIVTSVQKISNGKEVLVTGSPIFDADGNVYRVVTNVRDITELNRLNEELKESKLLASRYQTELSQLILERLSKEKIIAKSPGMMEVFNLAVRAAQTYATVLILGESGVGKEVLARVIHNASSRASTGTFVQINCGAIPENLLESELFGYEPGAFTGANREGKPGLFEIADRGTLLLDEIGDLSTNLQVKLLRVLQEQEIYRLGGTKPIKLDVRIIAATNRDIWERVQEGIFREDLFYRLNVLPIEVLPLRKRKEDILPLARHFIQLYNEKYGVEKRLDPEALPILESYSWPGNVRELQNVMERLLVITDGEIIEARQVHDQLTKFKNRFYSPITVNELVPVREAKELLEKNLIRMAFNSYPSVRKAAEALGLDHSNILRKAAKYGIEK